MVLERFPTLQELRDDPSLFDRLTPPQQLTLIERLREQRRGFEDVAHIPSTPGEMAEDFSDGDWVMYPHLKALNVSVTNLIDGEAKETLILLVEMPPQHGKSEFLSKWVPFWYLADKPKNRVILASYGDDFAAEWGSKTRGLVNKYGERVGLALDRSTTAADNWSLVTGGGMNTTGVGGDLVGRRADLFIIDDPHKNHQDARSKALQEHIWDWFQTSAISRMQMHTVMVVIGTRWHETDLIGRIRREALTKGSLLSGRVKELKFTALAEENDKLGRAIGEPLCPERFDKETLLIRKSVTSAYNWSAIYQQNPTPEEGNRVKRHQMRYYTAVPEDLEYQIQSWDCSMKGEARHDPVAGGVFGVKGSQIYLLPGWVHDRLELPGTISAFRALSERHPKALKKVVENKANGPALEQTLRYEIPGITLWPPEKEKMTSKEQRLDAVLPFFEAGNVWFPSELIEPRVKELVEELVAFPNAANDDYVDMITQALLVLRGIVWRNIARDHRTALEPEGAVSTNQIYERQMHEFLKKRIDVSDRRIKRDYVGEGMKVRRIRAW